MLHSQSLEKSFLQDAYKQLDEVLKLDTESAELKAMQQKLQRWLAIFAPNFLSDICTKLMTSAEEHAEPISTTALKQGIFKKAAPQKADDKELGSTDGSPFFLLETLLRVLTAATDDAGTVDSPPLRSIPDDLLPFCFERVRLANPAAIRHVAAVCVGILSRAHLTRTVEMFVSNLGPKSLSGDRDQREYVAIQRAAGQLELSVHSAEQAAASVHYLRALAGALPQMTRGVLRSEVCSTLAVMLERLMKPAP